MTIHATRLNLFGTSLARLVAVMAAMVLCSQALAQTGPGGPPSDSTQNAAVSYSDVFDFMSGEHIENASSALTRSVRGVTFTFGTTGLEPEAAYTVWVVVFNNPQFCQEAVCGLADLPIFDDADPRVEAALFWGAGRVSDGFGQATFTGNVIAGDPPPQGEGQTLFGPGLVNARKAEIHLVIRSHGPVGPLENEGLLEDALTTFAGGCAEFEAGPNDCEDVQFSIHLP